jgi:farnesyl diphosphate synthase
VSQPVCEQELTDELPSRYEQEPYVQEWIKRMLYYTIPGGKLNRGLTVLHSLEKLKGRPLKEQEVFEAHVLGWCVEWLQAFFLISDDIMDQSVTRRGQPCYYLSPHPLAHPKVRIHIFGYLLLILSQDPKRPTVGNIAINDSFLVESHIYIMIRKHFRNQPFYADLLDLFHETTYQTELGQLLDLTSLRPGQLNFASYTIERYNLIVKCVDFF